MANSALVPKTVAARGNAFRSDADDDLTIEVSTVKGGRERELNCAWPTVTNEGERHPVPFYDATR